MRRVSELGVAVVILVGAVGCGGEGGSTDVGATTEAGDTMGETSAPEGSDVPQAGGLPTDLALPSGIALTGPTTVQSETDFLVTAEIAGDLDQLASTWADGLRSVDWEVEVDDSQEGTRHLRATKPGRLVEISLDDTGAEMLPLTIRGRPA